MKLKVRSRWPLLLLALVPLWVSAQTLRIGLAEDQRPRHCAGL